MAFIEVDDDNFNEIMEEEFSKENIVLIKFGSQWCDPCQALEFELEELDENSENISILMVECEDAPELVEKYKIHQMPTIVIYKDKDTVIYHKEGVILCQDIQKIINEA